MIVYSNFLLMRRWICRLAFVGLAIWGIACVEPASFSDNYTNGYWIRYASISGDSFFSDRLDQAKFIAKIDKYYGEQPSKLELYVKSGSKEYLVKQLTWDADTITVTPLEIAKAIYGASGTLDSFLKSFPPSATLGLVYYPYDKNGNKVTTENAYGLGASTSYQNLNNKFTISVFCSFVIDDMVGTYAVTKDDNQDGVTEVSITKINDTTYQVNGYPSPKYDIDSKGKALQVVVSNTRNGGSRVVPYLNYGRYVVGGSVYSIKGGSGITYSCVGLINLNLTISNSATTTSTTKGLSLKRK